MSRLNKRYSDSELADFIRANIRYDPETGDLWWTKQVKGPGRPRQMHEPVGRIVTYKYGYQKREVQLGQRKLICSRVCWFLHYGNWPPSCLDVHHINEDSLDNRVNNLGLLDKRTHGRLSAAARWAA